MTDRVFQISIDRGLHVRPACALSETAAHFQCEVDVVHRLYKMDGKSMFALMSAGVQQGEEIRVICRGTDEQEAMAALEALITSGFEEVLTNE